MGSFTKIQNRKSKGKRAVWTGLPGAQTTFLTCPSYEVLMHGTRGGGKTDTLLMDYAQFVDKGFGVSWRGILFRKTYPELDEVINKSKKWFPLMFEGASYNETKHIWTFANGEQLLFRHMKSPNDYDLYHGHEYPWIGWEEITSWPDDRCYELMKGCCRSSVPGMPRRIRSSCNPWGKGHGWVKKYFIDQSEAGEVFRDEQGLSRAHIFSSVDENPYITVNDPGYIRRLDAIKDPNLRKAWRKGDWNIIAGGALTDIWSERVHVVPVFDIPAGWIIDRGFDWGSTAPFSVLWFAESDGTDLFFRNGTSRSYPKGTLFVIGEWYGANDEEKGLKMTNTNIGKGIIEREKILGIHGKVYPGPADSSIFTVINGTSIAEELYETGAIFDPCAKGPGSRINGLSLFRTRLENSLETPMEEPGFFVMNRCKRLIAHLPMLQRDEKNPDDVETNQPDHDYDVARYRCLGGGNRGVIDQELNM